MGPLSGLKVIEMAGLGPAPFCSMLLADLGAEVIAIHKRSNSNVDAIELHERGKKTIALNLKTPEGIAIVLSLIETADVLIEGFRPGVMERLGLGPDVCFEKNEKLIYGRMTGWGQSGPLSHSAGHDINYISLTGALHSIGPKDGKPVVPLNLVGDYGGGALYLALGILSAIFEAQKSGKGQVVDAAMTDGSASLMMLFYAMMGRKEWNPKKRESNLLDGGTPFYTTYETQDGKHISIGCLESQFYQLLVQLLELDDPAFSNQIDVKAWPDMSAALTDLFKTKTRDQWCELLEGTDVCFAPILDMVEATQHPHNVERETYITLNDKVQPAPAPKFSRSQPDMPNPVTEIGLATTDVLKSIGYSQKEIDEFTQQQVIT